MLHAKQHKKPSIKTFHAARKKQQTECYTCCLKNPNYKNIPCSKKKQQTECYTCSLKNPKNKNIPCCNKKTADRMLHVLPEEPQQ